MLRRLCYHKLGEKEDMQKKIDAEWVNLILEAKSVGVSIQEVRDFIQNEQNLNNQPHKNWK